MNWKLSVSRHCFIFEIFNGMKYTVQIFLNHLNKFFNVDRVEFLMYGNQYFNVPLPPLRFYTRIGSSTCTNLRASCNMNGNKILHWPRSLSNMMYAYCLLFISLNCLYKIWWSYILILCTLIGWRSMQVEISRKNEDFDLFTNESHPQHGLVKAR